MSSRQDSVVISKIRPEIVIPKINVKFLGVPEGLKTGINQESESENEPSDLLSNSRPQKRVFSSSVDVLPEFRSHNIRILESAFKNGLSTYNGNYCLQPESSMLWNDSKIKDFAKIVEQQLAEDFLGTDLISPSKESKLFYSRKFRSISNFLNTCSNPELFERLVLNHISIPGLVQTNSKFFLSPEERAQHNHFQVKRLPNAKQKSSQRNPKPIPSSEVAMDI